MQIHMGSLTVCVIELENCPEHNAYARFACHVSNRNTGQHLGTVLTNARFEGCEIPLDGTQEGRQNLQEILTCATRQPEKGRQDCRIVESTVSFFNFGPIFPGTFGKPATKLD